MATSGCKQSLHMEKASLFLFLNCLPKLSLRTPIRFSGFSLLLAARKVPEEPGQCRVQCERGRQVGRASAAQGPRRKPSLHDGSSSSWREPRPSWTTYLQVNSIVILKKVLCESILNTLQNRSLWHNYFSTKYIKLDFLKY